jgi:hypothetical protein
MRETDGDVVALQALLDRSISAAGPHLARVITPERRLDAAEVCRRLDGMRLLTLATVTADGRPLASPVDGIFYRGAWHFGTAQDALRLRHIRARPDVSATYVPGEEFAVTVHGRAEIIDIGAPAHAELREVVLGIYGPRYGPEWEQFLAASTYVRIEARRMFVFAMSGD